MDRGAIIGSYNAAIGGRDSRPIEIEMGETEALHGCWITRCGIMPARAWLDFGDCWIVYLK